MTPQPDLERCCRGDAEAWQDLVVSTVPLVSSAVRRVLRGPTLPGRGLDVDDIVQDVFVRLMKDDFRVLRGYDPARASFSTWITIVARSVTLDIVRRQHRETADLDAVPVVGISLGDHDPPMAWDDLPLNALSDRQQLVMQLLYAHGLTVPAAAETLGINEQTVRSTKHKALERLRAAMLPDDESARSAGRSAGLDT